MGNIVEYLKMALQNLMANKGRSFLTMLGIIIGISSVIMIMSVGDGVADAMTAEADDLGGGQVTVYTSSDADAANELMTPDDMEAIEEKIQGVEGVTPNFYGSGTTATGKGEFAVSLSGGTEDQQKSLKYNMKRGHYFTEDDVENGNRVCTILDSDAKRLFGSDDVIGMDIDVTMYGITSSYRIVGVMESKENTAFVSYTYEGAPIGLDVPYTSLEDFGIDVNGTMYMVVFTDKEMDTKAITDKVIHVLESRHQSAGEDYFMVENFQDVLEVMDNMMGMVTGFISAVAAISLLVGGIGVMNIMLVSVTERTREIGIRKSLGAKTSSIMVQFLAESAIISIIGGIIGILLGIGGGFAICSFMSGSMGSEILPGIRLTTILGATFFSCLVGIFFGIYPARKAARLSPIEALRRE